ncbi:hypothetical protein [Gulbenkiania mobilis]|uniref:Uncharacterized protein n=1 Tax=Gulbenkiania mobilis TaxID=397457 RepID=A0ABY2CYZ5_GULMO|nr:hypothetical protein EV669_1094 [Gulbenkiania mobilis]
MNSNLLATLVENHHALTAETPRHPTAKCSVPSLSEHDLSVLEGTIQVMQDDVAAALQGLGQLVNNYPRDIGDEAELLPKVGQLLRVLGDVLDVANGAAVPVANQQWLHSQIRLASKEATHADR